MLKNDNFVRNFYRFHFFYDFIFAYAIYTLVFSVNGIGVWEISLILAWWALVSVVLEIPSGALSDYWDRKNMLIIAPLIKSFCFIIWTFAGDNVYLYALGISCWAIGSTFVSGTSQSILYDYLKSKNQEQNYEKILGHKTMYFNLSLGISIVLGGLLAAVDLRLPIILSTLPLLASAFFATKLIRPPKFTTSEETHYLEYIHIAYQEIKSNPKLLYIFSYFLGMSFLGGLEEFDQLYYQLIDLPIFLFGLMGLAVFSLKALGGYYAYIFQKWPIIFSLFPLIISISLILMGYFTQYWALSLLLLVYLLGSPIEVLLEGKIQKQIKSEARATITSVGTLFQNLVGVILAPIFGLIGHYYGIEAIYTGFGFLFILVTIWALIGQKMWKESAI